MTFNDFLPPKTWAFIVQLGEKYNLSTKEIQRILINKIAFEHGMNCEHKRIGLAKKNPNPNHVHCKDCWTRFEKSTERGYNFETRKWCNIDKLTPEQTFLDKEEEEDKKKGQVKVEDRKEFQ